MKRGLYVTLGVILLVAGIALAALGTTVALSVGSDDAISTAPARVRGTGVAVVAEDFRVDTSAIPVPDNLGTLTLTVTGRNGRAVFVGAAKTSDIDTYLTGAPYDVVVDLTAGEKATTRKVPGSQQPQPPASQGFWAAQSSGAPAVLTAHVPSGDTLVVMNADATPVVDADVVVTLTVAKVWTYSWIAAGVGVLLALLALLLFWRARVAGRRRREAAAVLAQDDAAVVAATVLPVSAVDAPPLTRPPTAPLAAPVSVSPVDEDVVVAPPSAALAALVADAADEAGPTPDDTVEVPLVVPETAGEQEEAPAHGADVPDAHGPGEVPDTVDADEDAAEDPLFDELVAAHGADPVHDDLPPTADATTDEAAPPTPEAVDPSSTPTRTPTGTPTSGD